MMIARRLSRTSSYRRQACWKNSSTCGLHRLMDYDTMVSAIYDFEQPARRAGEAMTCIVWGGRPTTIPGMSKLFIRQLFGAPPQFNKNIFSTLERHFLHIFPYTSWVTKPFFFSTFVAFHRPLFPHCFAFPASIFLLYILAS